MIIFFSVLSFFCLLYYIFIVAYAGFGSAFVNFWIAAALGFAAIAALLLIDRRVHFIYRIPKIVMCSLTGLLVAGIMLCAFLFGCVVSGMNAKPERPSDYVIVLGAQIRGERITKSLAKRLDAAICYYQENSDIIIVVSGGQGDGEDVTEAAVMAKYLQNAGIPSEKIILEDKSTTTRENLLYSYDIICDRGGEDANIAICTNNFHIFRAIKLAEHIGISNVEGLAADSDNNLLLNYLVRDSAALFKEALMGNIDIIN